MSKEMYKVEHNWDKKNDRWIYIEYYDDDSVGLNYMQGNEYEEFKRRWCTPDQGLSEFYKLMLEDYPIERCSNTLAVFMNKVMWTYHSAISLSEEYEDLPQNTTRYF